MLELESGSNDPMAYMLTIVLIQVIGSRSNFDVTVILKDLFIQFLFGGVIGYAFGKFAVWLVNKIELSNSALYRFFCLVWSSSHLLLPTWLKETAIWQYISPE